MTDPDPLPTPLGLPHQIDHQHSDVTGGWLRAAPFGAMDGPVSNSASSPVWRRAPPSTP